MSSTRPTHPSRYLAMVANLALILAVAAPAFTQDDSGGGQDDETKALDSTATQWSFQFAYQTMDYKTDTLDNGQTRPAGLDNYAQLRIVAPIPLKGFTILPRLTVRHYENANTGDSGFVAAKWTTPSASTRDVYSLPAAPDGPV